MHLSFSSFLTLSLSTTISFFLTSSSSFTAVNSAIGPLLCINSSLLASPRAFCSSFLSLLRRQTMLHRFTSTCLRNGVVPPSNQTQKSQPPTYNKIDGQVQSNNKSMQWFKATTKTQLTPSPDYAGRSSTSSLGFHRPRISTEQPFARTCTSEPASTPKGPCGMESETSLPPLANGPEMKTTTGSNTLPSARSSPSSSLQATAARVRCLLSPPKRLVAAAVNGADVGRGGRRRGTRHTQRERGREMRERDRAR